MGSRVRMSYAHELVIKFGNDLIKRYQRKYGIKSEYDINFVSSEETDGIDIIIRFNDKLTLQWPIFEGEDSGIKGYWLDHNLSNDELPAKVKRWLKEEG